MLLCAFAPDHLVLFVLVHESVMHASTHMGEDTNAGVT